MPVGHGVIQIENCAIRFQVVQGFRCYTIGEGALISTFISGILLASLVLLSNRAERLLNTLVRAVGSEWTCDFLELFSLLVSGAC